jgi:hypothetical protein
LCYFHNSRHFDWLGATNRKNCQWSSGNFKAWWNSTYLVVPNWGVYLIQLCSCHNSKHLDSMIAINWRMYQWNTENFKAWWNPTYLVVRNWGAYLIQLYKILIQFHTCRIQNPNALRFHSNITKQTYKRHRKRHQKLKVDIKGI